MSKKLSNLKVAIVHDWLTHYGGAERCLEVFCEILPKADIYTLVYKEKSIGSKIEQHKIFTSFLQKIPFSQKLFRFLLPLMPLAIEQFRFNDYDLVISSSHAVAKGVITPTYCPHICYMYTPMRYIWFCEDQYFGRKSKFPLIAQIFIKPILHYLRVWDSASSNRVDKYIAISQYVSNRIKKVYNRESEVIYPPVDCERFTIKNKNSSHSKKDFYLMITNYEPNKNTEVAIEAFCKLGQRLKIVGNFGRIGRKLKNKYKKNINIEFLGHISDNALADLYPSAKALIAPGLEDFGMAVIEAYCAGTPVIAYAKGGHLETVVPVDSNNKDVRNATGIFFYDLSVSAIMEAVEKFEKVSKNNTVKTNSLMNIPRRFGKIPFKNKIISLLELLTNEFIK